MLVSIQLQSTNLIAYSFAVRFASYSLSHVLHVGIITEVEVPLMSVPLRHMNVYHILIGSIKMISSDSIVYQVTFSHESTHHQLSSYAIVYSIGSRFAYNVIFHVIGVLKSKSFQFNNHHSSVYHSLNGSVGLVALDP